MEIKVADEIWIATALLHREHPEAQDFGTDEIIRRVRREKLAPEFRPGVAIHLSSHAVANKAPNGGRYRLLVETAPRRRRLFRPGDSFHPERRHGKTIPKTEEIPAKYRPLLDWYRDEYARPSHIKNRAAAEEKGGSTTELLRRFVGCLTPEEAADFRKALEDFERLEDDDHVPA
jgi:hypothetical protein